MQNVGRWLLIFGAVALGCDDGARDSLTGSARLEPEDGESGDSPGRGRRGGGARADDGSGEGAPSLADGEGDAPAKPPSVPARTRKIRDLTGPGTSAAQFSVGGTDLGIAVRQPNGKIAYIFGDMSSSIVAKGKYDPNNKLLPATNSRIDLKNGYLKTKYYPNPITNIGLTAKIDNKKATYNDLKIVVSPARFTFEGNPVFVEADLKNFDDLIYDIKANGTLNVKRIYQVFAQKGIELDGTIKADIALKGKQSDAENGNYSKLQNKGTLEIQNIGVASSYLPKQFLIRKGIFNFNQDKMTFSNFLAEYGQSDFKMNGYMQNVLNYLAAENGVLRGSFTVESKFINADEFMTTTDINKATTTQPTENTRDNSDAGVIMIPPNLDLQLRATAQKVNFSELELSKVQANLLLKDGRITMKNTGFNLIGCNVSMDLNYHGISPEKAEFDYTLKATDFDIKKAYNEIPIFKEMVSSAENAEGIISLNYKLKGKLKSNMEPVYPSLTGGGVVSIKDVKVKGMKMFNSVGKSTNHEQIKNPELTKVDIKSTVKNNIITIERFKFKFAGFRPRIEGETSLDGKLNIKMRLGLPPFGIIGIPLVITGNNDNPKIKVGKKTEDLEEAKDTIP